MLGFNVFCCPRGASSQIYFDRFALLFLIWRAGLMKKTFASKRRHPFPTPKLRAEKIADYGYVYSSHKPFSQNSFKKIFHRVTSVSSEGREMTSSPLLFTHFQALLEKSGCMYQIPRESNCKRNMEDKLNRMTLTR